MRFALPFLMTLIVIPTISTALDCVPGRAGPGYWSWREIDGKKCWYQGKPGLAKDQLHWGGKKVFFDTAQQMPADPIVPAWVKTLRVLPVGVVELTPQQTIDSEFNMLFVDQSQITGDVAGFLARLREHGERRWRDIQRAQTQ